MLYPDPKIVYPLIGPGDPPPYSIYNDKGKAPVLLVADHASRYFPAAMNQLGLADWVLEKHVAWDIGSDLLACALADLLDAPAILAGFSRLIIDPNRQLHDATSIPLISDGISIPGNQDLDQQQRALRVASFFQPYHDAITARLDRFKAEGITPALLSVHTCTPVFNQVVRPWHVGVMWDKDSRIPVRTIANLNREAGVCVGDNEPYAGNHPHDYTIDFHAESNGLPHAGFEVRQDLVNTPEGAQNWANVLARALAEPLADSSIYQPLA
jgi:predicted N-formylglutamate amidohydrolase